MDYCKYWSTVHFKNIDKGHIFYGLEIQDDYICSILFKIR